SDLGRVMNDVGVGSVVLDIVDSEGNWHTGNETVRTSGDHRDGIYTATIPGEYIGEGEIRYAWYMTDFADRGVFMSVDPIPVVPGVSTGYAEDFEELAMGWHSIGENDSWEKGKPLSGPEFAVSGENVYATNLAGEYDNDADATLVSPPVVIPDDGAYLHFQQWHNFEISIYSGEPADFGHVVVSTDKEEWTVLETMEGPSEDWE